VSFIAEVLKHSGLADLLKNTNSKSSSRVSLNVLRTNLVFKMFKSTHLGSYS